MNELENALKVIKNECEKHANCGDCPLRNSTKHCYITEIAPYKWELIVDNKETYVPRVFCG